MDNYVSATTRQYSMHTSPVSHQGKPESMLPDQQLPSIRDVILPVRSNVTEAALQETQSSGRSVTMPYLSSQHTSGMSVAPISAPVQSQTNSMGYAADNTNHLQVNTLGSNHPAHTPVRSPAEYNSPWSTSSQYHEPQIPVISQPSLPSQGHNYSNMVQPGVGSDHDSSSFSSSYGSLNRNVSMVHESPANDSYARWRGTPVSTPQRYNNPYLMSADRSYAQPVYSQSPYDSYRSNLGYDSTFRPLDSSPYNVKYNPLMSYPTLMGYSSQAHGRRRRGNLPKPITDILRLWLQEHLDHPYPTDEQKQIFIQRTGLTISQISNWFINARRRQLPALKLKRAKMAQSRL